MLRPIFPSQPLDPGAQEHPRDVSVAVAVNLLCLGGRPAPRDLLDDLRKMSALSSSARQHVWEILGPCLGELNPADLADRVQRFCREHGAAAEALGDAVGAARHLIREASAADLSRAAFAEDLARIPGDHDLGAILLPGYDAGKALVRAEIARASVADHGKSLQGVDWRIDTVSSSHRGGALGTQVVMLTLRYERGNRRGRVTFQASPEALRELQAVCARILG